MNRCTFPNAYLDRLLILLADENSARVRGTNEVDHELIREHVQLLNLLALLNALLKGVFDRIITCTLVAPAMPYNCARPALRTADEMALIAVQMLFSSVVRSPVAPGVYTHAGHCEYLLQAKFEPCAVV